MVKKDQNTIKCKYIPKQFHKIFEPTGEILTAKVINCAWNPELNNEIVNVLQIDFDFFLALDYQNDETPWLRYGFLKSSIEIVKNNNNE